MGLVFPCSLNKLYLSRIFHPITFDNLSSRPAAVGTNMPLSGKEKKTSRQFTSHLKVKERQRVFVVLLLKTKHRVSNLMPLRTLYIIVSQCHASRDCVKVTPVYELLRLNARAILSNFANILSLRAISSAKVIYHFQRGNVYDERPPHFCFPSFFSF